jgi:hypothetical protein
MENGATISDLRTRFQFTTKEDRRNKNIRKISKCNKKLERFVHGHPSSIADEAKRSARRLSQDAHKSIARCWSCPCPSPHEAKLSLLKCLMSQENADSAINLDLLVSMMSADQAKQIWLESRIRILPDK